LVLSFHGFGATAVEQDDYTGLRDTADKYGFLLATPQASGSPSEWYLYGPVEDGYVDDFAFTGRLIDELSDRLCVDPGRIYATGLSNGAGMASLLGCELDDRLAAIAPIAGSPFVADRCADARPMPIIAFHGTADPLVPFEEQPDTGRPDIFRFGARNAMRNWAQHNGCDMTLFSQRIASDVVLESYTNCAEGADVEFYVIEDGGHTWPGATHEMPDMGTTTHSITASELVWDFFAAHPRR
jgi:polyhydroxybutyrate depolymerase